MRFVATIAALALLLPGCERPVQGTGTIHIGLDPYAKKWKTSMSSKGPGATTMALKGKAGPGEWDSALVLATSPEGLDNPYIVIRFFDEKNAVRVEITFTGTPIEGLGYLTFDHVTHSEKYTLNGKPYAGAAPRGENLEVQLPKGDGKITFLTRPHVH